MSGLRYRGGRELVISLGCQPLIGQTIQVDIATPAVIVACDETTCVFPQLGRAYQEV